MLRGPVPYKVNIQALWLVFSAGNGIDLAGLRKCHYLWLWLLFCNKTFLPNITWVFLETMGFVFPTGKAPEMAYTKHVPFLRESIHKIKNKKENKNLAAVHFLMWKFCTKACGEDFCSMTWVSCKPLPENWKRDSYEWVVTIHMFTQNVEIICYFQSHLPYW